MSEGRWIAFGLFGLHTEAFSHSRHPVLAFSTAVEKEICAGESRVFLKGRIDRDRGMIETAQPVHLRAQRGGHRRTGGSKWQEAPRWHPPRWHRAGPGNTLLSWAKTFGPPSSFCLEKYLRLKATKTTAFYIYNAL